LGYTGPMQAHARFRFPFWQSVYRDTHGHERVFESQAGTLAAHLALLALQEGFSPGSTAEHQLVWDTPDPS